jgi:hypothetical protein
MEHSAVRAVRDRISVLHLGWCDDTADRLTGHDRDVTFVVATADAHAPARNGRVVVVPDPDRLDDVVSGLLRASIDVREFDCVCSGNETGIVPAAILAAAYGRAGLPVATAVALRDRTVQKRLIRAAGIPVAGREPVTNTAGSDAPVPFVPGSELHVNGVVRHGTVLFLVASRDLRNVIEINRGGLIGSVTADPDSHPRLYSQVHDLTSTALRAIGYADGVFHIEAFEREDRLVFHECAARIGGDMVLATTRAKFGVDLYDEWARSVFGHPSGIACGRRYRPDPHGWVQLTARPGRIVAMPSADELRARPGIVAVQPCLAVGDTVPDPGDASNARVARVVMRGATEEDLADDMRTFASWFADRVEVTDAA